MSDTQKLKDMLDNLVNGKPEMAQVAFHDYLRGKLHGAMGSNSEQETPEPVTDTTTKE